MFNEIFRNKPKPASLQPMQRPEEKARLDILFSRLPCPEERDHLERLLLYPYDLR
jgi:hypothetical protein